MTSLLPSPSIQLARSLQAVAVDDVNHMTPFQLFKSQMEAGSMEGAIDAMKRASVVAIAMGPDDAASQLLPYLTALALKQPPHPDELLLLLGQQLIPIADLLGKPFITEFLPMLERLAAIEETVVREQAVTVLCYLCDKAAGSEASPWVGLAKRLAAADWFTAKVSATGIIAPILNLTNANVSELLNLYKELCQDETPMVRRAAAKHLGTVLEKAGWDHQADFAVTVLPPLCRDEQDSVRLLAVASLATAGTAYGEHTDWTCQHWLPIVKDGSTDMSWRVRHNLAKHFSDVANNLGIQKDRRLVNEQSLVMACFVSLLTDSEAEVRAAGVGHLARMVAWGGPGHFTSHLQPLLPALADDVVMEVRSKCALALMDAAHGGTLDDAVILQAFGPLLESFLQDEFHEVQLQVLTNLHKIAHLLPGLSGVVTSLLQMSKATNWRVREAVAQLLPHLAEARGLDFFVSVLLEPAWLTLLLDPVATVRLAIVSGMPLLVQVAGEDWILQTLLPQHIRIYNQHSTSYLIRMTLLRAHVETACAAACTPADALWNDVLVQILRGLVDKVANVRMAACKGLARIIRIVQQQPPLHHGEGDVPAVSSPHSHDPAALAVVQTQIRPALEKRLAEEEDEDCRQACQKALDLIILH